MEESKKTIFDQLAILYYRKWLFIVPILVGTLAGAAISYKLPEYYTSSTVILVEEQQVPEEYVTPADKTPFSQRLNAITQQVFSRNRLQQIIKDFNLYSDAEANILRKLSSVIRLGGTEAPPSDSVIDRMRNDIRLEVLGEPQTRKGASSANAFAISYDGTDPETTMRVADTLASLFVNENTKAREEFAEGTTEFLGNELKKSKSELESIEKDLKGFREKHMGSLPEQLEANLRTLDRLQLDLQNARAGIKTAEDRKIYLEEQMKSAQYAGASAPVNPLVAELDRLRNELSLLRSVYKDGYPDVIMMKKRIRDLEGQISAQASAGGSAESAAVSTLRNPAAAAELSSVKSQIANLRQREADLRGQIKEYENRIEITPRNEQRAFDLKRDYDMSLANYQRLLEKKMSASLAENLEKRRKGARFRIIDPANRPMSPTWPNKLMVTLFGLLGGGTLGTGLVFLSEIMNPAFRKPEDFDGVLAHPVLTSIPVIPYSAKKQARKLTVIKGRK